jgi:hypothetical protein
VQARRSLLRRTMVLFRQEFRIYRQYRAKVCLGTKIPETLKSGFVCNGMKNLISDDDSET